MKKQQLEKQHSASVSINKALLTASTLLMAASASLQAAATYDTFTTDPNISTEWTEYTRFGSDLATATWNSTNQNLDLAKSPGGNSLQGLSRNGSTRSAGDQVRVTINSASVTGDDWAQIGMIISAGQQPALFDNIDKYEFVLRHIAGEGWRYMVRREVGNPAGSGFDLYVSPSNVTVPTPSTPLTLDIIRNGANYDFVANGTTLYTASYYSSTEHDSMQTYLLTWGTGTNITSLSGTIDNFGVIPEPSAALLGGLGALLLLGRRR